MAWDAGKPSASAYLVSADLRSNWAAIADQALGRNLFGDPDYLIWGSGTSGNAPSWWNISGQTSGGNIGRTVSSTTITIPGSNSGVNLNYSSGALELYQNCLSTGDMTTSIKKLFHGQGISAGAWVYTNSADCRLVLHGPSSNVVSSAIGTGVWTWITKTMTLASSTMTRLGGGIRTNSAGATYIAHPTLVLGPIPPDYPIPGVAIRGTIGTVLAGNPVAASTAAAGSFVYQHHLPFKVEQVSIIALSSPASTLRVDCRHYNGTSWATIFSATSNTTKPTLTSGIRQNVATPDGVYYLRCFDASVATSTSDTHTTLSFNVEAAPTAGGNSPTVSARCLTYAPPLQSLRSVGTYK